MTHKVKIGGLRPRPQARWDDPEFSESNARAGLLFLYNELAARGTIGRLGGGSMAVETTYKYLEPRPGSNYRQLFVKGRKIRAQILYRLTVNPEPRTPEQVAEDYQLPVEAVLEAIDYSLRNEGLLREEREQEAEYIRAHGLDKPPFAPPGYRPDS